VDPAERRIRSPTPDAEDDVAPEVLIQAGPRSQQFWKDRQPKSGEGNRGTVIARQPGGDEIH